MNVKNCLISFKTLLTKKKRNDLLKIIQEYDKVNLELLQSFYSLVSSEDGYKYFLKWTTDILKPQPSLPAGNTSISNFASNTPVIGVVSSTPSTSTGTGQNTFTAAAMKSESINSTKGELEALTETTFFCFMEALTRWKEHKILDVFDMVAYEGVYVNVDTFYILICLLLAKEAKQLLSFLNQFSGELYDIFKGPIGYRNISYVIDGDDYLVTKSCKLLKITNNTPLRNSHNGGETSTTSTAISKEDFVLLYYYIFKHFDAGTEAQIIDSPIK